MATYYDNKSFIKQNEYYKKNHKKESLKFIKEKVCYVSETNQFSF